MERIGKTKKKKASEKNNFLLLELECIILYINLK